MNNDRIEGNWKEMKGKVQQKWGKLTDDDLDVIDGRREELVGKIQQEYGKSRDEAEKEWTHISINLFVCEIHSKLTRCFAL